MKTKMMTTLLSCVALAALSATASAAVMTYTQTATLSGTLGGISFTDAAVTFRMTADTANIQTALLGDSPSWTNAGVTTIDIAGFETATFNGSDFGVFAADFSAFAPLGTVGFTNLTNDIGIAFFFQGDDPSYSLATAGTFTGAGDYQDTPFSTTLGDLVLSGISGNSTFTAAAVPEPSAFALLGLGALGLAARRRRVG
jgi:hypothetical protein